MPATSPMPVHTPCSMPSDAYRASRLHWAKRSRPSIANQRLVSGQRHDGQMSSDPLGRFSALSREWFAGTFAAPTAAQAEAWSAIADGANTLVIAPTGSGKTLAAFLWAIDRLAS